MRDDVRMSDTKASPPRRGATPKGDSVLGNLPRTRPQRSSPRRAAARKTTAAQASAGSATAGARKRPQSSPSKPTSPRASAGKRAKASILVGEPSPRQGFECDGESMTGTVTPPGGADLLASAAELVGELAKASASSGERLLKDVLSRLRPS